ncbi:hypothetical protein [Corallibacter sp.]|uniref:hypothetical protein n=1 Tax=Corallibacter sp. TaxID=2038084 RepID=UPI003A8D98F7
MSEKIIPIQEALTDSLSLSIPFEDCRIIDGRLTDMPVLYYPTLDEFESELMPPKPITIEYHGIKLRFSLAEIPDHNDKKNTLRFIRLTLNSKLLHEDYFQGIRKDNTLKLYNRIISFNVIRFSYKSFLQGRVNDIDICYNDYAPSLKHFCDALDNCVIDALDKAKYLRKFIDTAQGNYGLSFNQRHTAKPSTPFIKLYYKETELINRSPEFWNTYLFKHFGNQIKNLTRIEVTIRNYAHKKRLIKYGLIPNFKTLEEYLEIPSKNLKDVIIFSNSAYIGKDYRVKSPNLSPSDHIIFELIQNCLRKGFTQDDLLNIAETFHSNSKASTDVSRSRIRSKIKDLSKLILNKDLKLQTEHNYNNHVNEYLKRMNLYK